MASFDGPRKGHPLDGVRGSAVARRRLSRGRGYETVAVTGRKTCQSGPQTVCEDALWRPATSDVIDAASSRGAHSDRQPTDSFDERRAGRMSDNDVLMPWDERGRSLDTQVESDLKHKVGLIAKRF